MYPNRLENVKGNNSQVIFITHGTILAPVDVPRTQMEQELISTLIKPNFRLYLSPTDFVQLQPIVVLRQSTQSKSLLYELFDVETDLIISYYYIYNGQGKIWKSIYGDPLNQENADVFLINVQTYDFGIDIEPHVSSSIDLTLILDCKFVSFNVMEYQMTINNTVIPPEVKITLDLNGTELEITDNKELIMVNVNTNGRLDVCIDFLDIKLNEHYN